jgi:uncharacterized integral membrane protein
VSERPVLDDEGPGESRRQRLSRHARRTRLYTGTVLLVVALVILVLLIAANTRSVKLGWVVGSTNASLMPPVTLEPA